MGLSLLASSVQSGATEGCKQTGSALFSLYVLGELVGGGERAFCFSLCNVELYLFAGDNKQRVFGEGGAWKTGPGQGFFNSCHFYIFWGSDFGFL